MIANVFISKFAAAMTEDSFTLEINYKGRDLSFEVFVLITGYTYKFRVALDGIHVVYEPDEERNMRALLDQDHLNNQTVKPDTGLIKAIGDKLESLFNSQ